MAEKLEKVRGSCANSVFCITVHILKIKVDINRICLFMVKAGSYFYDRSPIGDEKEPNIFPSSLQWTVPRHGFFATH